MEKIPNLIEGKNKTTKQQLRISSFSHSGFTTSFWRIFINPQSTILLPLYTQINGTLFSELSDFHIVLILYGTTPDFINFNGVLWITNIFVTKLSWIYLWSAVLTSRCGEQRIFSHNSLTAEFSLYVFWDIIWYQQNKENW